MARVHDLTGMGLDSEVVVHGTVVIDCVVIPETILYSGQQPAVDDRRSSGCSRTGHGDGCTVEVAVRCASVGANRPVGSPDAEAGARCVGALESDPLDALEPIPPVSLLTASVERRLRARPTYETFAV